MVNTTATNFETSSPKISPEHDPELEAHSPCPPDVPACEVEKEGAINPFTYTKPDIGTYCPGPELIKDTVAPAECSKY